MATTAKKKGKSEPKRKVRVLMLTLALGVAFFALLSLPMRILDHYLEAKKNSPRAVVQKYLHALEEADSQAAIDTLDYSLISLIKSGEFRYIAFPLEGGEETTEGKVEFRDLRLEEAVHGEEAEVRLLGGTVVLKKDGKEVSEPVAPEGEPPISFGLVRREGYWFISRLPGIWSLEEEIPPEWVPSE